MPGKTKGGRSYDNILTIIDQIKYSIDRDLNVVDKLRKDSFVRISYEHREKELLEYIGILHIC